MSFFHKCRPSRTGADVASYPCTCTSDTFDVNEVQSIMADLDQFWPSNTGQNTVFWTHEYEKHGTCAAVIPALSTELKFMSETLTLRANQNTLGALAESAIKPSSSATYSSSDISAALQKAWGYSSIIHCSGGKLTEVATCYDNSLRQIDCDADAYGGSSCSGSVSIPPSNGPQPNLVECVDVSPSVSQCQVCDDYCSVDSQCPESTCVNGLCKGSTCTTSTECDKICS